MQGLHRERILTVILFLGITALHFLPWITVIRSHTPDRFFLAIHNSRSDYPVYLDYIKQGLEGSWRVRNSYAIEPHEGTFFYWIFLLFGQIGRFFGTRDAQLVYHGSTIATGLLWFLTLYVLSRYLFRDWKLRLLAFGTFLYSTSFPLIVKGPTGWTSQWYMSWWTELDPIQRAYFLPHHVLGHTLVVWIVLLALRAVEKYRARYLIAAIPMGLVAGFIHPPSLIIVLMILPVYVLVRMRWRLFPAVVVFSGISSLSLLFIQNELKRFPIEGWYESLSFAVSMKEYLLALGPVVPLSLFGLLAVKKKPVLLLFVLWAVFSITAVDISRRLLTVPWPILRAIPISNVRFLQHAVWIPLGVLTVSGFDAIRKKFGNTPTVVIGLIFVMLTIIGYPSGYSAYSAALPQGLNDFDAPPKEWGDALGVLSELPPGPVFAMQHASFYLPGLTGRPVYLGREFITLRHNEKAADVYKFNEGMEQCKAFTLLKTYGFSGVLYGFDEQKAGDAVFTYPFLEEFKRFGNTVVFRITEDSPPGCGD